MQPLELGEHSIAVFSVFFRFFFFFAFTLSIFMKTSAVFGVEVAQSERCRSGKDIHH